MVSVGGGVASLAWKCVVHPVAPQQDASGLLPSLLASGRFHAVWATLGSFRMLALNFYAISGASSDDVIFSQNQDYLAAIFEFAAQYTADHPVVLAGDFQADPLAYAACDDAVATGVWLDPLQPPTEETLREPTFSRDKTWLGSGPRTAIDTVLLNGLASRHSSRLKWSPCVAFNMPL